MNPPEPKQDGTAVVYACACCAARPGYVPMAVGHRYPADYLAVPLCERGARCQLDDPENPDVCVIDGEACYLRGSLELPVRGGEGPFVYGVWCRTGRADFERAVALWKTPGREAEPPYGATLCTDLPLYPATRGLRARLRTRAVGLRPAVELEAADHPLAAEQREGLPIARVREIVAAHGFTDPDGPEA